MLDPGRGRTKTGYLWAIARDDRPWGGSDPPAVVHLYAFAIVPAVLDPIGLLPFRCQTNFGQSR